MKIYELLDAPEKWTQGAFQRDATGQKCIDSLAAVAWCLTGAYHKCYNKDPNCERAQHLLSNACGGCVVLWNDAPGRTYQEVIGLCRQLDI